MDIAQLKNFGPYMVKTLHKIGIHSKEDLLNADYREIKRKLIAIGIKPHLNFFYSIEMGLQDKVWSEITPFEKKEIQSILKQMD